MNRRTFLESGLAAGAGAALGLGGARMAQAQEPAKPAQDAPEGKAGTAGGHRFKLRYAPHFGMFERSAGKDPLDQLRFGADQGFTAWEDNGMAGRHFEEQEKIGKELARLNLTMGGFCASIEFGQPTLVLDKPEVREKLLVDVRHAIKTAKRVNGKWAIVVPGCFEPRMPLEYQTANVIEHLKAAADVAAKDGLILILEPLNWRDHPNLFLRTIAQAYQICRAVGSPACKILDDVYHQQITEGDLIVNIDKAWSEIAYFHLGDNPGRREPGTGEINFRSLFRHLHAKGYQGVLGMEHGLSQESKEGEQAVIAAYRACDSF